MRDRLKQTKNLILAVISDTHGLIRPSVYQSFKGADAILHAGDIDNPEILDELKTIAPVVAVRGNMDLGRWADDLPKQEIIDIGSFLICMVHNIHTLDLDPVSAGIRVVISGHTHQYYSGEQSDVLFLNPGSAGPKRKDYAISAAILHVRDGIPEAEMIFLDS